MSDSEGLHAATIRKVSRRLIPFLIVLYVTAYLDRVNVGFAALEMNADLKFSAAVFGFGSGVFFLGYCLFEVPSNIVLARVGARIWICRIMVSWGIIASAMALVKTPTHFHVLRFLLGAAEAGFFPGVIFYLSQWYPASARARAIASFMIGIPQSGVIGGPLSGFLLNLNGNLGLAGWQWLFLIEGVPPIVLGIVVFWYLTDEPRQADWLSPIERESLESEIAHESRSVDQPTTAGRTVAQQLAVVHAPLGRAQLVPSSKSKSLEFFVGDKGGTPELVTARLREGGESHEPKCGNQAHCEFVVRPDHHQSTSFLPLIARLSAAGPGNPVSHPAVP